MAGPTGGHRLALGGRHGDRRGGPRRGGTGKGRAGRRRAGHVGGTVLPSSPSPHRASLRDDPCSSRVSTGRPRMGFRHRRDRQGVDVRRPGRCPGGASRAASGSASSTRRASSRGHRCRRAHQVGGAVRRLRPLDGQASRSRSGPEKPVTVGGLSGTQFTFDETSFTPDAFAFGQGRDRPLPWASDMTTTVVPTHAGTTLVITASGITANKGQRAVPAAVRAGAEHPADDRSRPHRSRSSRLRGGEADATSDHGSRKASGRAARARECADPPATNSGTPRRGAGRSSVQSRRKARGGGGRPRRAARARDPAGTARRRRCARCRARPARIEPTAYRVGATKRPSRAATSAVSMGQVAGTGKTPAADVRRA